MKKAFILGFAIIDITKVLIRQPRQVKHIFKWLRSLFYKERPLDYDLPWLTYEAINWLKSYLSKKMRVFEWGGGSSTAYFAKKVKRIISVEHEWKWYKLTKESLAHRSLENKVKLFYRHIPAEYCQTINKYPDNSFDLVLVDGEARNICIKLAKRKVRSGGYLMLDNSDVQDYKTGIKEIEKWPRQDFPGIGPFNSYSWQTSIWQKLT